MWRARTYIVGQRHRRVVPYQYLSNDSVQSGTAHHGCNKQNVGKASPIQDHCGSIRPLVDCTGYGSDTLGVLIDSGSIVDICYREVRICTESNILQHGCVQ